MEQIALIIAAFGAGVVLRTYGVFEESSARYFNRFVIYISLPALVLLKIHDIDLQASFAVPVSMPWIQFFLSFLVFTSLGRFLNWRKELIGALVMTAGLGNTSFVGFPLVETFFGKQYLPIAILADQLGSFLVVSLLGVPTAIYFGGGSRQTFKTLALKVIKFPPFVSLILAFLLIPFEYPSWVTVTLDRLGGTLLPVSLFSVGLQTRFSARDFREVSKPLSLGLLFKLGFSPLIFVAIYIASFGIETSEATVTVFLSAMAPMITAGIVATENGLDKRVVNLMLGVGIPLSLVTSSVWYYFLR